jgi:hypothetical protein
LKLKILFSFSDQLLPPQHDEKLKELQTTEIELHCLDLNDHPGGARICTVNEKEFIKLGKQDTFQFLPASNSMLPGADEGCYMLERFTGGNEQLPSQAVMVSRWCQWPYDMQQVDCKTAEFFVSAYKSGFGSRSCTEVIGLNLYQGTRQGHMATPDLTRGPGEAIHHQYHRQYYCDMLLSQCETILSTLTRQAKNLARAFDPIIYRLLLTSQDDDPVLGVCRRKILTMGLLARCLGFANSSHTDHFDFYSLAVQEELIGYFKSYLSSPHSCNKICAAYLQRWVDQYEGFCRPTTCGYVFSGSLKGNPLKIRIYQYFVMEGLGLAVRFMDETVHHFYGNLFAHNTAVCVAIGSNGKVSYKSDPFKSETFRVFAWGGS